MEFSRIEFPDIEIARENQKMASEYFSGINSTGIASFLHLGNNYETTAHHNGPAAISPNGSNQNSEFLTSTTTNQSDDRSSAVSGEKKNNTSDQGTHTSPETPTSKKGSEVKDEESGDEGKFGQVFSSPLGNINLESGQSAMQQQIVDMYMRSMQQFTESLAKMKLPMDLGKKEHEEHHVEAVQSHGNNVNLRQENKKDGSRVFYGSRAFF